MALYTDIHGKHIQLLYTTQLNITTVQNSQDTNQITHNNITFTNLNIFNMNTHIKTELQMVRIYINEHIC